MKNFKQNYELQVNYFIILNYDYLAYKKLRRNYEK